ncbi:uncharacterized protein LOC112177718 [Rosa chinensis]|uniref:uncharacterized protein LOC112177718 n=1 Tax=Rosa chinensis TaxID=74649 RepID=UPI000D08B163|nr:uncharacterized protein LOC112177718 [Rosa chinensis]
MDNTTKGCNKEGTRADETRTNDEVFNDVPDYKRLKVEDMKATMFKIVKDAERFYSAYSLALGFGFWKDTKGEAEEHSHELATGNQTAFIRSHRNVGKSDLACANTMSKVSIRPCHMYEYMVEQAGGYKTVGFIEKDRYNKLDQQRHTTSFESDSEGALAYMNALAAQDPYFYYRFNIDIEDRKRPIVVLIDGDETMRSAIEDVMPQAKHRLCAWYLSQNANTNLKCDKKLKAFNRNHFMAGMRSTQRCEGMNRFIKDSIRSDMKLVEVILRMDRAVVRLSNNQVRDDFNTMNSTPVLETQLKDLENHVASIYTYDVFKWIRKEIRKESQATLRQGP